MERPGQPGIGPQGWALGGRAALAQGSATGAWTNAPLSPCGPGPKRTLREACRAEETPRRSQPGRQGWAGREAPTRGDSRGSSGRPRSQGALPLEDFRPLSCLRPGFRAPAHHGQHWWGVGRVDAETPGLPGAPRVAEGREARAGVGMRTESGHQGRGCSSGDSAAPEGLPCTGVAEVGHADPGETSVFRVARLLRWLLCGARLGSAAGLLLTPAPPSEPPLGDGRECPHGLAEACVCWFHAAPLTGRHGAKGEVVALALSGVLTLSFRDLKVDQQNGDTKSSSLQTQTTRHL